MLLVRYKINKTQFRKKKMSYWQTAYISEANFRKKEEEERKEKEINRKIEKENKERHKKELEKELEDKRFVLVEKDHDKFDIPPRPVKKMVLHLQKR